MTPVHLAHRPPNITVKSEVDLPETTPYFPLMSNAPVTNSNVAIVILNYKNYGDTIACLRALTAITYPHTDTIIVDNDSQNDSLDYIRQDLSARQVDHACIREDDIAASGGKPETTILIQSSRNRGYAAGNNLGIRLALAKGASYVLLLNNDTRVEKGFLEPLVRYAETHEHVAAVGPKVLDAHGQIDRQCARRRITPWYFFFANGLGKRLFPDNRWIRRHTYQDEYAFENPQEVEVLSGCCMLIKSSVFRRLGLLDENTFLYYEEMIFHELLRHAGLTSAVVPQSVIVHRHGQSTALTPKKTLKRIGDASLLYYLTHYRHYSRFTAAVIMLSRYRPKRIFRILWNAQR